MAWTRPRPRAAPAGRGLGPVAPLVGASVPRLQLRGLDAPLQFLDGMFKGSCADM